MSPQTLKKAAWITVLLATLVQFKPTFAARSISSIQSGDSCGSVFDANGDDSQMMSLVKQAVLSGNINKVYFGFVGSPKSITFLHKMTKWCLENGKSITLEGFISTDVWVQAHEKLAAAPAGKESDYQLEFNEFGAAMKSLKANSAIDRASAIGIYPHFRITVGDTLKAQYFWDRSYKEEIN